MGRFFTLWRLYAWLDLTWVTRNPTFFVTYLLSDLAVNLAAVTTTLLLVERFGRIGPWSREQILFMLGFAMFSRGLVDVIFGYNVAFISRRIGRGQLDHTLIQPQPLWISFLTEGFTPFSGGVGVIPGLLLLIVAGARLRLTPHPAWLGLLALNLGASITIVVAFSFTWGSLAFWAPRGAEEISTSSFAMIDQLKPFPLDTVGVGLASGLLSVVPAGFVAWYPSRALLGLDPSPSGVWVTPVAALIFAFGATLVFRQGLRHYGFTGSGRYHSMGHRR